MFLIEWFDIGWFWLGRITGGILLVVFTFAIIMTILEKLWPLFEGVAKAFRELKSVAAYLKWKRDRD